MAITIDDFSKIWASTSPLTPYEFSEDNYKSGWNFVGATPPSRQMWDFLQKNNDEKMQYLANNYLPLSGGTMTGTLTLDDGGTALSNATVGTVVSDSKSSTSVTANTSTEITHISLTKGVWVVTGKAYIQYTNITADKSYGLGIDTGGGISNSSDGYTIIPFSVSANSSICVTRIITLSATTNVALIAFATVATTYSTSIVTAVRIV